MPQPDQLATAALLPEDYDTLDALLEDLRPRFPDAPQWEFCEGFMAALLCCRQPVAAADYWEVLLDAEGGDLSRTFDTPALAQQFQDLWDRRWAELQVALDTEVDGLEDERAYCPQVLDVRGAVAAMPQEERAQTLAEVPLVDGQPDLPSFAQVWALGFMYAVEAWPDAWEPPSRDKETADWIDDSMAAIAQLCEADAGPPEVSAFELEDGSDGPPSMSAARMEDFGEAVWAVYALRRIATTLGPRVPPHRRADAPGRNDPCPCGSGRKYKKCHGAA